MNIEKRYFAIGVFFIGGCITIAFTVIILAGGTLFKKPILLETYFDQSVQGLDIGSPVKYRGVKIGEVKEIRITGEVYHDQITDPGAFKKQALYVMVIMSLDTDMLKDQRHGNPAKWIDFMVNKRGLRLRLEYLGITGLAYLELDFIENNRPPLLEISWKPHHYYIPSMSNTIQLVSKSLNDIAQTLSNDFAPFMKNIKEASAAFPALSTNLNTVLISLQDTLIHLNSVTKNWPEMTHTLNETVARVNRLLARESTSIEVTIENLRVLTEDLQDVAASLKSNPSRLLFGKPPPKKEVS